MVNKVKASEVASASGDVAALGISYAFQMDDKRGVTLQTHLPVDCEPSVLNAVLDKMRSSIERQEAYFSIAALKRSLSMQEKQLRRVTEDLANIDGRQRDAFAASGKKGQFRLTVEQEKHRENVLVTQGRFREEIEEIKRQLKEAEDLTNAIDRSSDS